MLFKGIYTSTELVVRSLNSIYIPMKNYYTELNAARPVNLYRFALIDRFVFEVLPRLSVKLSSHSPLLSIFYFITAPVH